MTTQFSAGVQMVIDASTRSAEIGNAIGQAILANGFDSMTAANKETMITCFEAAVAIMSNLVEWNNGDRSYDTWLKMFIEANTNEKWMAIDSTGELTVLANKIINEGDLVGYFNDVVLPLDLSEVPTSIETIKEILEFIHTRVTID